ncbi:MAG: DUF4194 domain-containing protein [Succinivibrionaceae bacterium]|nr:DUF4194 domain-containing protein [Succinivibrionaceae bacterium]MBQ8977793.1 DUF4194 domain-containing protein [Succinivibrionaceae bacterium]
MTDISNENYSENTPDNSQGTEQKENNPQVSEFSAEIRNTIIELLKHGSLTFAERPNMYKTLCSYQNEISSYLRNINILLAHNEEMGVAYIKNLYREEEAAQQKTDDILEEQDDFDDDSHLISSRTLSEFDSIVILVLRKYYHERYNSGETNVFLDVDQISSLLIPYVGVANSATRTIEKINGTLTKLQEKRLIRKESGNFGDRVEVLPLIRFVINAEFMTQLLEEYHNKLLTRYTEEELEKVMKAAEQEQEQ